MSTPRPGTKTRGSRSGAPINALFDLLGRRWALGVIWNLGGGKMATFRELQAACDTISPSILNIRIKELREADIVEKAQEGYRLTERGRRLRESLVPLGLWSWEWAEEVYGFARPEGKPAQ
jgi:DNA-binding HxlR family transcriptional regulator